MRGERLREQLGNVPGDSVREGLNAVGRERKLSVSVVERKRRSLRLHGSDTEDGRVHLGESGCVGWVLITVGETTLGDLGLADRLLEAVL